MDNQNPSSSKADRKTIEKNRRNEMKALYAQLTSLLPRQSPREVVSLPDQLEGAANYIKKLENEVEKMKQKKKCLVGATATTGNGGGVVNNLPSIDVRVVGSTLEVVLVTGPNCQFMFTQIIRMLHGECGQVVHANFSVVDDTIFHTIHFKMEESSQDNAAAARISERLRKFVYHCN